MRTIFVLVVLALVACKQSDKDAWKVICNARVDCCAGVKSDVERVEKQATWISDHVSNQQALDHIESLYGIGVSQAKQRDSITAWVKEAGLDPADCPLLRE